MTGTLLLGAFFFTLHCDVYWDCLGSIESGGNDRAVGQAGEVSRYQIKPALWRDARRRRDYADEMAARSVGAKIMAPRLDRFMRARLRPPTAQEWYVLWNAPAKIDKPSKKVLERAQRFENLVMSCKEFHKWSKSD